jgi:hypothetical protein
MRNRPNCLSYLGLIILSMFSTHLVYAQEISIDWANGMISAYNYGGEAEGKSIALDVEGNVYVLGYFTGTIDFNPHPTEEALFSAKGAEDIFLVKYTTKGEFLWANCLGSPASDAGISLAVSNSGYVYASGYFSESLSFDPTTDTTILTSAGGEDIFIAKYDSKGAYQGAIRAGGAGNDRATSIGLQGSSDVYITGSFEQSADFNPDSTTAELQSQGGSDVFIAKYTSIGSYVWAYNMGSPENDYGNSIALDGAGNLYLAGKLKGTANFNPKGKDELTSAGESDVFIAKYDYNGIYQWAESMGGPEEDEATALTVDIRGNIFLTGRFRATANFNPKGKTELTAVDKSDVFLARYNNRGEFQWANRMGGAGEDYGTALEVVGGNHVVLTGCFTGTADFNPDIQVNSLTAEGDVHDIFIAKYTFEGTYVWSNRVGGTFSEYANALALNAEGQVYMTGCFEGASDFDPSDNDVVLNTNAIQTLFVAHYDAESSAYGYAFGVGYRYDASISKIKSVQMDAEQNVYIAGYFEGAVNFNPLGQKVLTSAGRWSDVFLAKYDSSGQFIWLRQMGGVSKEVCNDMALDAQGNIYLTGYFEGKANFNRAGNSTLEAIGDKDIFLVKYAKDGSYQWAKAYGNIGRDEGQSLEVDQDGNILLTGIFEKELNFGTASVQGSQKMFLAKFNAQGQASWAKAYDGQSSLDVGAALCLDQEGNIYLSGHFNGNASFDASNSLQSAGGDDIFLVKYSKNGSLAWAKRMGGRKDDRATAITVSQDQMLYVTGRFKGNAAFGTQTITAEGSTDAFLVKYSLDGDFQWVRKIGGTSHEEGLALACSKDHQVFLTGYFQGTTYFDAKQELKLSSLSIISSDIFLAKFDAEGNCLMAKGFGGTASDQATALCISSTKSIYMAASFQGKVDFDPRKSTKELDNQAIPSAAALVKYLDYEFLELELLAFEVDRMNADEVSLTWTTKREANNAGFEVERKLEGAKEFSKVGYIYGFGDTEEPTDYRFTDMNAFDGMSYYRFRQMDFNGRGTYSKVLAVEGMPSEQLGKITLYPLPVNDELNIRFGKMPEDAKTATVRILDSKGKLMHEFTAGISSYELLQVEEVKDLENGRYLVNIKYTNGEETTQEFVKEAVTN